MPTNLHSIAQVNALNREEFIRLLGPVFEKSPWIAEEAAQRRPFSNFDQLRHELCEVVRHAAPAAKLELIRAHPELADRLERLTSESHREQSGAGLDQLTAAELELFRRRNAQYREKFGFPFVICARLNQKEAILGAMERRLQNSCQDEMEAALAEIFKIAELRLRDLVRADGGRLTTHVLDTAAGRPAADMKIELWQREGAARKLLRSVRTNNDGRCDAPLLNGELFQAGDYELIFFVGDYFSGKERFLDRVPVCFTVTDPSRPYHIPLLCSPWSYTTYRGS